MNQYVTPSAERVSRAIDVGQYGNRTNGQYNDQTYADNNSYNQSLAYLEFNVLRSSWNSWPTTKNEANEIEIPVSIIYTPFNNEQKIPVVNYGPIRSRTSGVILSPTCNVDFTGKIWNDPISGARNQFPPHYANQISENCLPNELLSPAIDYIIPNISPVSISYCFVVDTILFNEELEQLKDSLMQVIGLLPENSNIALITFGATVSIHELGFTNCVKVYSFKSNADITAATLQSQLKFFSSGSYKGPDGKFLCKLLDVEEAVSMTLDNLEKDPWVVPNEMRPVRCTGTAIAAAVSLMECLVPQLPARIMVFTGGVATAGLGSVASRHLSSPIRQHQHLNKNGPELKAFKQSSTYYKSIANRAIQCGHAIDLFCCSLDQTGLAEMRVLCEKTGGICILTDTFSLNVFKDTLKEMVKQSGAHSAGAYAAKIELICSKEISIAGAIGCITGTNKNSSTVSSIPIGEGNTCEWVVGVLHPSSTIAFYFELNNTSANFVQGKQAFIQLQCTYTHPQGERRIRVHTITYPFNTGGIVQLGSSFDQEAATIAMARLAVHRTETEEVLDTLRWLDRKLIRLSSLFADYQKDVPSSFKLPGEFAYYPTFMYHFRRGPFIETVNNSPDETAFYRLCLLRENLTNTITMISPSLLMYDLNNLVPIPVGLDSAALRDDCVLLMDSFFYIVLWHGQSIARWKEQGYHEQKEYAHLKILLQSPAADAINLLKCRLPCPKFVTCSSGGSQERFLLARVNPSKTIKTSDENSAGAILTEEVSITTFIEHLAKLVTKS